MWVRLIVPPERSAQERADSARARVVDQQIDATALPVQFLDQTRHPVGLGEIGRQGDHVDLMRCADLLGDPAQRVAGAGHEHEMSPSPREFVGVGLAESLRCAGDECGNTAVSVHDRPSPFTSSLKAKAG
jgi:hypothetical protein